MKISSRAGRIEPFYVMEVAKAASAMAREVAHTDAPMIFLNIGEPDFTAPPQVQEAAVRSIHDGATQYTQATGLLTLRERISGWYATRFGVDIPASRIVVTAGASAALQLACLALIDAGDEILMPDPSYPCNRHFVSAAEGAAVLIPTTAAERFQLSADKVAAAWGPKTRGVLLASPSNPTGTSIHPAELRRIHEVVQRHGGITLVDEIYLGLSYDDTFGHRRAGHRRPGHQHQQLLQVLQHDRLAPGLDGGARDAGARR
jgi:aspartate/methionine/tyrosine aminotransferase